LVGRHRAEHHLPRLQRRGKPRVADGVIVEVGAQRENDQRRTGQLAQLGDEVAPLRLVGADREDRLELVHDDRRPAAVVPVSAQFGQLRLEVRKRRGGRFEHRHRSGDAGSGLRQGREPGQQARAQQRRLARPRWAHQHQRYGGGLGGERNEQFGDVLATEEPARVLRLESGQSPVRVVGPPAGRPPRPRERLLPLCYPAGVFLPADVENPEQLLAVGRQMASGEIVAGRAHRNPGGLRDLTDL
jgi:hypothetical protein